MRTWVRAAEFAVEMSFVIEGFASYDGRCPTSVVDCGHLVPVEDVRATASIDHHQMAITHKAATGVPSSVKSKL